CSTSTATPAAYRLPLHDALRICDGREGVRREAAPSDEREHQHRDGGEHDDVRATGERPRAARRSVRALLAFRRRTVHHDGCAGLGGAEIPPLPIAPNGIEAR